MNQATSTPTTSSLITRLSARVSTRQQQVLGLLHAAGDARAREHGWTITTRRSPLGLGSRVYRDPRFAARQQIASLGAAALESGRSR